MTLRLNSAVNNSVINYKYILQGNDRCPRCNDRVYYAEKVVANGINWHKVSERLRLSVVRVLNFVQKT